MTGKRQWKATVTDPDEPTAKRASFEITLIAEVQPVPTTTEVLPGMRPIEFDGLTAEPRVAGNGEFKYQSYVYRATGFSARASAAGTRSSQSIKPSGVAGSGEQPGQGRVSLAMGRAVRPRGFEVLAGRVFGPPGQSLTHRSTVRTSGRALRAM